MKNQCTLVISSTDEAQDMWKYYSIFQKKYWNDCPFEIVLINETLLNNDSELCFDRQVLAAGSKWSDMLMKGLDEINTKYVILNFEDQWPKHEIDNYRIMRVLNRMRMDGIGCMQMFRQYKNRREEYIEIPFGKAYRMSCSASVWDREFLLECLEVGESPWRFETYGSYRDNTNNMPVFAMTLPVFPFVNAMRKGVIRREAVKFAKMNNVMMNTDRKRQSIYEDFIERAKSSVYDFAPNLIIKTKKKLKREIGKNEI